MRREAVVDGYMAEAWRRGRDDIVALSSRRKDEATDQELVRRPKISAREKEKEVAHCRTRGK